MKPLVDTRLPKLPTFEHPDAIHAGEVSRIVGRASFTPTDISPMDLSATTTGRLFSIVETDTDGFNTGFAVMAAR